MSLVRLSARLLETRRDIWIMLCILLSICEALMSPLTLTFLHTVEHRCAIGAIIFQFDEVYLAVFTHAFHLSSDKSINRHICGILVTKNRCKSKIATNVY